MSINSQYRTDKRRETEGVVIKYTDSDGNVICWFRCRRPGGRNIEFQKTLNRYLREHREELQTLSDQEREALLAKIQVKVYAESVILEWGGDIEGPNGEVPPECNFDNIFWLFYEDCPDLFENLQIRLSTRSTWKRADKEAAAKNSEAASSTS